MEIRSKENWGWNWSREKTVLEYLFYAGLVTTADRRNFERVYDLTERVIPERIRALPTLDEPAQQRGLISIAAAALGVATDKDLALAVLQASGRVRSFFRSKRQINLPASQLRQLAPQSMIAHGSRSSLHR